MEELVAHLSTRFLSVRLSEVETEITRSLGMVGEFLGIHYLFLHLLSQDQKTVVQKYQWIALAYEHDLQNQVGFDFCSTPWIVDRLGRLEMVFLSSLDDLPPEAHGEKELFISMGIKKIVAMPLFVNGSMTGYLASTSFKEENWSDKEIRLFRLVSEILASVLARRQVEQEFNQSQQKLRNLIEQVSDGIVLLDHQGGIVEWNQAMEKICGLPKAQVKDKPIWQVMYDLIPENAHREGATEKMRIDILSKINLGRSDWRLDFPYRDIVQPGGKARVISITIFPVQAGNSSMVGCMIRDITEIKQTELRLQRQIEELSVLNAIVSAGAEATDEAALIRQTVDLLSERLYQDSFGIFIFDADQQVMRGTRVYRYPESLKEENVTFPLRGIIAKVMQEGKSYRSSDISSDENYYQQNPATRSELCVPLRADSQIFGVFNVESSHINAFRTEDEQFLNSIAGQLAVAFVKIRLFESERQRRKEAEALANASFTLVSTLEPALLLENTLQQLAEVIPYDIGLVSMWQGNQVRVVAEKGLDEKFKIIGKIFSMSDYPELDIFHNTHSTSSKMPNMQEINRKLAVVLDIQSWLIVPLMARSVVIGNVLLMSRHPGAFSKPDLAQAFANQLAVAVENANLFEQTWRRATEMEALAGISATLRQVQSTREIHQILAERVREIFQADMVMLFRLEGDRLILKTHCGGDIKSIQPPFLSPSNEIYLDVIHHGRTIFLSGDEVKKLSNPENESAAKISSCIIAPLMTAEVVVGVLQVVFFKRHYLSTEDRRFLMAIAEIGGIALYRASLTETLEQRVAERTSQLSVLYDISALTSETLDSQVILERSLNRALEALHASVGAIHLLDAQEETLYIAVHRGIPEEALPSLAVCRLADTEWNWRSWIVDHPEPLVIMDVQHDRRLPPQLRLKGHSVYLGMPVRAKGQTMGLFSIFGENPQEYSSETISTLAGIADQIGRMVEVTRLRKQAETIAVMEERQRLARELHDSVTQSLYSVNLMANATSRLSESGNWERARHYLKELSTTARLALKEMRLLVYELRPTALEEEGLEGALRQRLEAVERRADVKAHINVELLTKLAASVEEDLYRIAMEALNNVLKHSEATSVWVNIRSDDGQITLEVSDNGSGFDLLQARYGGGIGLKSMQERTAKLGGSLEIQTNVGEGTRVKLTIKRGEHG